MPLLSSCPTLDANPETSAMIMLSAAGDRINWFANAERGAGLDSGSYIFQPLPAGRAEVSWPGGYTFELTPVEERSEPPWSAS